MRLWGRGALLVSCTIEAANHRGGSGDACGLWLKGEAMLDHCRVLDNPCAFSLDGDEASLVLRGGTVRSTMASAWDAADTRITAKDVARERSP